MFRRSALNLRCVEMGGLVGRQGPHSAIEEKVEWNDARRRACASVGVSVVCECVCVLMERACLCRQQYGGRGGGRAGCCASLRASPSLAVGQGLVLRAE